MIEDPTESIRLLQLRIEELDTAIRSACQILEKAAMSDSQVALAFTVGVALSRLERALLGDS